jgi:hypothetical protein
MSYDNLSSVSQNVLKFYQQLTGEERRVPFIFGRNNHSSIPPYNFVAGGTQILHYNRNGSIVLGYLSVSFVNLTPTTIDIP